VIKRIIAKLRQRRLAKSGRALTGVVTPSQATIEKIARDLNEIAAKNGWALSDTIETAGCACGGNCACGAKKPAVKKPAAKKPATPAAKKPAAGGKKKK